MVDGDGWGVLMALFPPFIFCECSRVYSRGPDFADLGGSIFFSIMCLYGRAFAFEV